MMKVEQLKAEMDRQISHFDEESKKHKRIFRGMRYVVFVLTGLSTVLAGAALNLPDYQRHFNLAIVLVTAAAGVATSIEGIRKPAELWVLERNLYDALKDLQREVDFRAAGEISEDDVDSWFGRMQEILITSTEKWTRHISAVAGRGINELPTTASLQSGRTGAPNPVGRADS
jgi:hypothetical protein